MKHPYFAELVAEKFAKEIVRLHGMPKTIVSDRDSIFTSNFLSELFRLQGTKLTRSATYHREMDGRTEVMNRGLETYLHGFTVEQPKQWLKWLSCVEFWWNSSYQIAAGMSPFEAIYGRPPPPPPRTPSLQ